jgi:hypothetical protein
MILHIVNVDRAMKIWYQLSFILKLILVKNLTATHGVIN